MLLIKVISQAPLAPHQLVVVQPGTQVVISLPGFNLNGAPMSATITSLPVSGTLYQLSQVFSTYGYEPKTGEPITAVGQVVTGSKNRLVYVRPAADVAPYGKWDSFTYIINDPVQSQPGTVSLVPPSGILVGSTFLLDSEGWSITGNKLSSEPVTYVAASSGLLNQYVYGTDALLKISQAGGDDASLWYFKAPQKFLGNQGVVYGGFLQFTLSSSSGDFDPSNLNSNVFLVQLYCALCSANTGMTIVFPLSSVVGEFQGRDQRFQLVLTESSGWLKDPKNTLQVWQPPSKCEFIQMLSGLTSMTILGDFTKWYESVSLDDVAWVNQNFNLPVCAQGSPDAFICTCQSTASVYKSTTTS